MTAYQAFVLVIAIWVSFGLTHSLLASSRIKTWVLGNSPVNERSYRVLYNVLSALFMLVLILVHILFKAELLFDLEYFFRIPCYLLIFIGLWTIYRSFDGYDLREFLGLKPIGNQENGLQRGGLNAELRHPLYFGSMLIIVPFIILFPRPDVLISGIMAILYLLIGTSFEEKKLVRVFADEYRDYAAEVPRFFPRKPVRFLRLLVQKSKNDS